MNDFTNDDYINLKKNSKEIFKSNIHENRIKEMLKKKWESIRDFPYQSYEEIRKWQLKRISFIVDYAYENIPLYRKKI